MEPKKAVSLVKKLGLKTDRRIARHFRNLQSYLLLEEGIINVLENPETRGTGIIQVWAPFHRKRYDISEKDIAYFKKYYGIGCEPITQREIGKNEGVTAASISLRIEGVLELLRQNKGILEQSLILEREKSAFRQDNPADYDVGLIGTWDEAVAAYEGGN